MASPPVKFDVLDHRAVRRELEAETKTAAEDLGLKVSYAEDNLYLVLSFVMIAVAGGGQLLPGKIAENKPALAACVATYYLLSLVTFLISRFVVQDYFLVLLASSEQNLPKLRVMLKMKRLDPKFTLVICGKEQSFTSEEASVTQFIHEDGYVAKERFHSWVKEQISLFKTSKTKSS